MDSLAKATFSVLVLFAIIGFFTVGAWVLPNGAADTPVYLRNLPVLQYNREVIEQQGMIINALQEQNKRLQTNLEETVAQANDIIGRLQGADQKTTESAAD